MALMTWSSTATRGVTGPRRPLRGLGGFGSLAFSIPLGLSAGRPLSPFSRAISARWAATVCSRAATLPSNLTTNAFSSVGESASRPPGGAIPPENQRQACQGSENHAAATRFAAVTLLVANYIDGNTFSAYPQIWRVSPVLKLISQDFGVLTRAAHFPKVPAHVELIDEALSPTSFMTVTVLRKSLFQRHEAEFNE